ncbi:hypothetical protein AYO21_10144 [Fonsecaea monophora]|uniref:DUF3669 domain-containing protein n=1 Tax=Fonsecaea monophora TaxID=254056 RepID=A0A177EUH4_9EURO|nr:hypothetical protein AYO21_10144 [Fonsecaea monophora]KAH0846503.1 hypothetical protein FOPE_12061 [Fonsecaea pedrosoi]OAG35673.1 hypothetical protein AYO21_10144 [Fonsecaea monophora]
MGHILSCFLDANRGDGANTKFCRRHSVSDSAASFGCQDGPKQVGKGQCGAVWALMDLVLKASNEVRRDQLWKDSCNHRRAEVAVQQAPWEFRPDINIPRWISLVQPSDGTFWSEFGGWFPQDFQPTCGVLSTRVHGLPAHVREAIVDLFAPESIKAIKTDFLANPENQDCLIRLYLGRRAERSAFSAAFRLRDFELKVNEMEFLQLDTSTWARAMAQMLAVLHWRAQIDANGVEFVLGKTPHVEAEQTAIRLESRSCNLANVSNIIRFECHRRSIGIWLLDFNQCRTFSESPAGVRQLQRAFYLSDPYYPSPVSTHPNDMTLWDTFKAAYLEASASLTESEMPELFIEAVEEEGQRRGAEGSLQQSW